MEQWAPEGFRVEQALGSAGAGELWRAREEATGAMVVLQRLSAPALLDRTHQWAALGSPYVVGVRQVLDGEPPVLVLDLPAAEPLAGLLRRRGRLTAGEAVTVGVPVAQALAQAHAAGLVHGALAPSSVLVQGSGMPLLADLGTGEGAPADDVRALVELCRQLLGAARPLGALDGPAELPGDVPEALRAVLEDACAHPPAAAELAQRLRGAHPASPLRGAGTRPELGPPLPGSRDWVAPPGRPARGAGRPRRARPPSVALAAVTLAVTLAVVLAALVLGGDRPASRPSAPPVPAPAATPDWAAVVQGLDRARERAWAAADPGLLAAVYAPGTAAAQADAAALDGLRRHGRVAVGVRHRVVRAEPRSVTDERVELRVVDVLAAQEVRDARGALVQRRPGRGERGYDVVLVRAAGGWRVADVRPSAG